MEIPCINKVILSYLILSYLILSLKMPWKFPERHRLILRAKYVIIGNKKGQKKVGFLYLPLHTDSLP